MEERKSMGGALVDVFDAGVALAKTEVSNVSRKVGDVAKAKGLGVVLLLAATGPLILALIFLILAVFFALMRFLNWHPWAAALTIALFSLLVTGGLVMIGLQRLGAEVNSDEPLVRRPAMTDDHAHDLGQRNSDYSGERSNERTVQPKAAATSPGHLSGASTPAQDAPRAAGEHRVVSERPGSATLRVEEGTVTVPVYESQPDGTPQMYGSGLNEKLDQTPNPTGQVNNPVPLRQAPGIAVSTDPTYQEDMKKGEL